MCMCNVQNHTCIYIVHSTLFLVGGNHNTGGIYRLDMLKNHLEFTRKLTDTEIHYITRYCRILLKDTQSPKNGCITYLTELGNRKACYAGLWNYFPSLGTHSNSGWPFPRYYMYICGYRYVIKSNVYIHMYT